MLFKVVGLKFHKYIGTNVSGHNCEFTYYRDYLPKYYICLRDKDNKCWEIELYQTHQQCYSGWTTSSYGVMTLKMVNNFGAITHSAKPEFEDSTIEIDLNDIDKNYKYTKYNFECGWFTFDMDGDDEYYPHGYVTVNMERFNKLARGFDEHPTWIFKVNLD